MTDLRRLAHAAVVTGFVGPTVPDWLARRIDAGLGGVCWFAQNVEDERRRPSSPPSCTASARCW